MSLAVVYTVVKTFDDSQNINSKTEDQVTFLVTNPGLRLVEANILVSRPRVRVVIFGTFDVRSKVNCNRTCEATF